MKYENVESLPANASEEEIREMLSECELDIIAYPDNSLLYYYKHICEYRLSIITKDDYLYSKSWETYQTSCECLQKRSNQMRHLAAA